MSNFNQPHESVENKGVYSGMPFPGRVPPSPTWTSQDEMVIQPHLRSFDSRQGMLDDRSLPLGSGAPIPNGGPMPTPPPTSPAVAQEAQLLYPSREIVFHNQSDLQAANFVHRPRKLTSIASLSNVPDDAECLDDASPVPSGSSYSYDDAVGNGSSQHVTDSINDKQTSVAHPLLSADGPATTRVEQLAPNAYVVVPRKQAPDFPNAKAALSVFNPSDSSPHFRTLPLYDYTFADPDGTSINFTAVEMLVFLPRLYINQQMAWRLVCNGISNPAHFEIVKTHRHWDECLDNISVISNGYLDALRGHGWRYVKPAPANMWSRKGHQTPEDWNSKVIDVNGFVPDRVIEGTGQQQQPPSVRFAELLRGVKKIPEGADAADLTRAIEYAVSNRWTDSAGIEQEFIFPDHLSHILNTIGRTQITPDHLDGAVGSRYEAVIRLAKNAKRKEERHAQMIEEQRAAAAAAASEVKSESPVRQESQMRQADSFQPLQSQPPEAHQDQDLQVQYSQDFARSHLEPPQSYQRQALWMQHGQDLARPLPEVRYSPLGCNCPLPSQDSILYSGLSQSPPATLIRDEPIPADHDFSEHARVVRFAQRPDQTHIDWLWKTEHVAQILPVMDYAWDQWAQMQFASAGAPLPATASGAMYPPMTNDEYQDIFGTPIEVVLDDSDDTEGTGSMIIDGGTLFGSSSSEATLH